MPWLFRVPLLQRWDERRRRRIKSSSKCPLNLANYSIFFISFDSIPGIFDIVVHGPTARVDIRLNERHIFFFLIIGFRFYFCPNLNFVKSKSMFVINAMLRCSQNRDRHKKKTNVLAIARRVDLSDIMKNSYETRNMSFASVAYSSSHALVYPRQLCWIIQHFPVRQSAPRNAVATFILRSICVLLEYQKKKQ